MPVGVCHGDDTEFLHPGDLIRPDELQMCHGIPETCLSADRLDAALPLFKSIQRHIQRGVADHMNVYVKSINQCSTDLHSKRPRRVCQFAAISRGIDVILT